MRSVMAAGMVVAELCLLSRVTGTDCGVIGDFVRGSLEAGESELGVEVEPVDGSG